MSKVIELEASSWIQTLLLKKREILIGTVSVLAGISILILYFQSGPKAAAYAQAQEAFNQWHAAPGDQDLYEKMKDAVRKVPALQKKYEAVIAQKLLDVERTEEALKLAGKSLARVKGEVPYHTAFAASSLLIEQGSYQEALEKAVRLKELMSGSFQSDSLAGGALLYAHNLLRIAFLQQELKNRPGEKAAWEELEAFLQPKSAVSDLVLGSFSDKKIDLNSYIAERKKSL